MDKTKFQSLVHELILENSPTPTIKRSELKIVIKEAIRTILNEMAQKMTGPYSVYSKKTGKYYLANKDEVTGVFYYLHMDTGTFVPLGTEKSGDIQVQQKSLKEDTTTAASPPINLPGSAMPGTGKSGWVSKKGGSRKGLAGTPSGYSLTNIGSSDMERKQDPV